MVLFLPARMELGTIKNAPAGDFWQGLFLGTRGNFSHKQMHAIISYQSYKSANNLFLPQFASLLYTTNSYV